MTRSWRWRTGRRGCRRCRPHHHAYTTTLPGFWPVKDYRGDIRIDKRPNGSLITWTATFVSPVPGLGKPLRFGLRTLITRLAAALAKEAEDASTTP